MQPFMPEPATADDDLMIAVEEIRSVRGRGDQPSDGGTGRSDHNDSIR